MCVCVCACVCCSGTMCVCVCVCVHVCAAQALEAEQEEEARQWAQNAAESQKDVEAAVEIKQQLLSLSRTNEQLERDLVAGQEAMDQLLQATARIGDMHMLMYMSVWVCVCMYVCMYSCMHRAHR